MRIKDLIHELQQIPEDQQNNAIDVFDEKAGTYLPIHDLKTYDSQTKELSTLNPLLIVINHRDVK